ncbi:5'/3'-nucleotidase sure [Tricladium varicosporioides]|nr:5'/3'-nucleotidase sure [Hymenoscyphus varicosporioides]
MRFFRFKEAVAAYVVVSAVSGLNILISNDDGFGTSNIRELYKAIKAKGHNAYIVASSSNQSGMGGTVVYTNQKNLTGPTEFGIVKTGAPSVGPDPIDDHIWYYNGTPSACVQVGLDYVLPRYGDFKVPDLVLAGPNYGLNLGPFLYTLAGTLGATYTAVERGIPAIAFSAGYAVQTAYYDVNLTTKAGFPDPATIAGQLAANLAQQLIDNTPTGSRLLPYGYGINVNIPYLTSFINSSCINPPFIQTRLTGGAYVDFAAFNETTGLFSYQNIVSEGTNSCINGDCSLPGEQDILNAGCQSSVSIFTVDYDAPITCHAAPDLRSKLQPLVQYANSTGKIGGLNSTTNSTGTYGNGTVMTGAPSPTPSTAVANAVERMNVPFVFAASALGLIFVVMLGM